MTPFVIDSCNNTSKGEKIRFSKCRCDVTRVTAVFYWIWMFGCLQAGAANHLITVSSPFFHLFVRFRFISLFSVLKRNLLPFKVSG